MKNGMYFTSIKIYYNDIALFQDGFYNNKQLVMKAKGFPNESRVDFEYELIKKGESTYARRESLLFLNLSLEKSTAGLYTNDAIVELTKDGERLYYKKAYVANVENQTDPKPDPDPEPELEKNGTVADELLNINKTNMKGPYLSNYVHGYTYGDFVYNNGYWWKLVQATGSGVPGDSYAWKRIDMNYTHENNSSPNNLVSTYEKGDVVIHNGIYYRVKATTPANNFWVIEIPNNEAELNQRGYWEIISKEEAEKTEYEETIHANSYQTIVETKWPDHVSISSSNPSNVDEYVYGKDYKTNDIVKVKAEQQEYYYIYIKIFDRDDAPNSANPPGSGATSGWQRLSYYHEQGSAYAKGDVVRLDPYKVIRCNKDVNVSDLITPDPDIWNKKEYWQIIQ